MAASCWSCPAGLAEAEAGFRRGAQAWQGSHPLAAAHARRRNAARGLRAARKNRLYCGGRAAAPTPLSRKGFRYERDGARLRIVHGEEGFRILTGIAKAVEAMLNAGNNILYDEMLQSPEHWNLWQPVIASSRSTVIHLHADEKTLLAREGERGRSPDLKGLALGHLAPNEIEPADLRIDTGKLSPAEVADKIYNHLHESRS